MQYVDAQSLTCGVPKSIPFYPTPYRQNTNISLANPNEGKATIGDLSFQPVGAGRFP